MKDGKFTIVAAKAFALGYYDGRTMQMETSPYLSSYLNIWYRRGYDEGVRDHIIDRQEREPD